MSVPGVPGKKGRRVRSRTGGRRHTVIATASGTATAYGTGKQSCRARLPSGGARDSP